MAVDYSIQVSNNMDAGMDFWDAGYHENVNTQELGGAMLSGVAVGATYGLAAPIGEGGLVEEPSELDSPGDNPLTDQNNDSDFGDRRPGWETGYQDEFFEEHGYRCTYCGEDITDDPTIDHIIPNKEIREKSPDWETYKENYRYGPNHTPACRSCNSSKRNNDVYEWHERKFEEPYDGPYPEDVPWDP